MPIDPAPSTNVPFPDFGASGFVAPPETDILAGVKADTNAAFGGALNFTTTAGALVNATPQAQLASSETAIIGDSFAMFCLFANLVDPAYSFGRMQDAIGRIYFISRIPGAPTVQPVLCVGLPTVQIPIGALLKDQNGVLWLCQQAGEIPIGGSVTLDFACSVNGPTIGPESFTIYQAIGGWDSATPSGDAALGRNVESPSEFEGRRSLSTGLNSMGPLNAIYAAVAAVADLIDVYAAQNNTASPVTIGGVSVAGRSIYIAALGGTDNDVADAILSRKSPGCGMVGNTTVSRPDPNPAYSPAPLYSITFERPTIKTFAVVVNLANGPAVPSNALALIRPAIISGFAGTDGGPRAKIGSTVFASRYYGDVAGVSNTYNRTTGQVIPGWSSKIVSILVGISGAAAQFTGAISGTTLTVSGVTGAIAVGQLVQGNNVANGTIVTAGSGSTWSVSISQTASSEAMTGTTLSNDVETQIDWAPTVTAATIHLILL